MGGRGAGSGAGGGGSSVKASSVVVQSGDTIDLSAFPLTYGKPDPAVTGITRAAVDTFENSHLKNKTEYGLILDANGKQLYTAHGGKGSVRMPTVYYHLAKGGTMTHNHPRGKGEEGTLGGTFSGADMNAFAQTPISTMRASAAEGTYSITKGANFDSRQFAAFARQIDSRRTKIYQRKANALLADCSSGKITYKEFMQKNNAEFNHMLVGMHNDLLAGQQQYGYSYTLERRSP